MPSLENRGRHIFQTIMYTCVYVGMLSGVEARGIDMDTSDGNDVYVHM